MADLVEENEIMRNKHDMWYEKWVDGRRYLPFYFSCSANSRRFKFINKICHNLEKSTLERSSTVAGEKRGWEVTAERINSAKMDGNGRIWVSDMNIEIRGP
ncbi:hypothetical protein LOAG_08291 [Loa loa]|uniref:Uncharacterized protein n=1 Tax=Loa loa TaxID=7209 RepID=A0A1S0TU16_LOALO|nr:hypothetical protein LOAG_08291 [Loa loa]EFO20198.1 hypothetical protein LOAG_08291 [Loa loa]